MKTPVLTLAGLHLPTSAASRFWQQQMFFFKWYLLLTVAPVFAPNSFENTS